MKPNSINKRQRVIQRTINNKNKNKSKPTTTQIVPIYTSSEQRTKIAIIQTGSWGDNINSTLMFKPIKQAYPNCILDIHTSTYYSSAFHNNPYIDNLIEYEAYTKESALHLTLTIRDTLVGRGYDIIFSPHPMFNHAHWNSIKHPELGDNLICAWIRSLEHTNISYDWPLETILRLTQDEINKVNNFINKIPDFKTRRKNIMEIHGESGQTFWNNNWTDTIVNKLCSHGEIVFISHKTGVKELENKYTNLCFNVNHLSIRECAELYNHCDRFFSVSSGLSNACNTNWCKHNIEWIEVTNSPAVTSAPIRTVGKTFWHEDNLEAFTKMLDTRLNYAHNTIQ